MTELLAAAGLAGLIWYINRKTSAPLPDTPPPAHKHDVDEAIPQPEQTQGDTRDRSLEGPAVGISKHHGMKRLVNTGGEIGGSTSVNNINVPFVEHVLTEDELSEALADQIVGVDIHQL